MKKYLPLLFVSLLSLTSCGSKEKTYDTKEYILEQNIGGGDFRILQLTDIHMANKDNRIRHYKFLESVIVKANPDMIVITGDSFTFADKKVVKEFVKFFDDWNVPWTITFGNHDEQCYFSVDWLTGYLNNHDSNLLFIDHQDDDVMGNANFAINLKKGGSVFEQLIIMDSNRYNFGEYTGYDYIHQNQIDWYERVVKYSADQNGGAVVPSMMFFHIPLPEFTEAYNEAEEANEINVNITGDRREKECSPDYNSGLFDKVLELGSTKAIFVGHDHVNNYHVNYKGIILSYGVTSTDRVYSDNDRLGGQVITLHNDHSIGIDFVYETYED